MAWFYPFFLASFPKTGPVVGRVALKGSILATSTQKKKRLKKKTLRVSLADGPGLGMFGF